MKLGNMEKFIALMILLSLYGSALGYATISYINGNTNLPPIIYVIIGSAVSYAQASLKDHSTEQLVEKMSLPGNQ